MHHSEKKEIFTHNDPRLESLSTPLRHILEYEIGKGNEIDLITIDGWSEIDICITLKYPFAKDHSLPELSYHRNTDRHYALNDSYSDKVKRQAIEAPTVNI